MARFERFKTGLARIWTYRNLLVWVLYLAGLTAFAALPLSAHKGYTDEKALVIGAMGLSIKEVGRSAISLAKLISPRNMPGIGKEPLAELVARAATLAAAQEDQLPPPPVWYNTTTASGCRAVHAVIPGGRGDGSESLLLAFHVGSIRALTVAVGMQATRHLSTVPWLAKDLAIVFLETRNQSKCSALSSMEGWLESLDQNNNDNAALSTVPALELIQQGLVVDIASLAVTEAHLGVHGYNGQLPNLDMVILTKRNLDFFTALLAGVGLDIGPAPAARFPNPGLSYSQKLQNAAAFAGYVASGRPSGAHAALLSRGIDAVSVTFTSRNPDGKTTYLHDPQVLLTARNVLTAAEMVIRTCNNLHERLHHASSLYVLVDAEHFVTIGAYMAPPGVLLVALVLQVANALSLTKPYGSEQWKRGWIRALMVHAVVSMAVLSLQNRADSRLMKIDLKTAGTVAWILCTLAFSLIQIGPTWCGYIFGNQSSSKETLPVSNLVPFVAVCATVLLLEAAALLLYRWALCFVLLSCAVPLLQLLNQFL